MANLEPEILIQAYCRGAFPMTDRDGRIRWYTADPRGIIPLERFHIPRTLRAVVRQGRFEVHINRDFEQTMRQCMLERAEGSWISEQLVAAYVRLHTMGFAHSVETWRNEKLVGGLYGVSLGAAFFGESMFHRETDASKVALVHLVQRLRERGYDLLDAQARTKHLAQFGCVEIPAVQYMHMLDRALRKQCTFA